MSRNRGIRAKNSYALISALKQAEEEARKERKPDYSLPVMPMCNHIPKDSNLTVKCCLRCRRCLYCCRCNQKEIK